MADENGTSQWRGADFPFFSEEGNYLDELLIVRSACFRQIIFLKKKVFGKLAWIHLIDMPDLVLILRETKVISDPSS